MSEQEAWLRGIEEHRNLSDDLIKCIMDFSEGLSDEMIIAMLYALVNEMVDRKIFERPADWKGGINA